MEELWLMHGEIRVAKISVDPDGSIQSVTEIASENHMPPGTLSDGMDTLKRMNRWWSKRAIPASRWKLYGKLKGINVETPESLMVKSMGISLSDSYWAAPAGSSLEWSDVNYYRNEFSDEMSDLLFDGIEIGSISFDSPDTTLNGNLKKRWKIIGGKRFLIKGGSGNARQEPFNEVIASRIMTRLGIPHTEYSFSIIDREPYSLCPCFSDIDREFIPSWGVLRSYTRSHDETLFGFTLRTHEESGLEEPRRFFEQMIVVDYLMANEDRHFGNFGILRDPESLRTIGFAPIFDTGSSLGFSQPTIWIKEGYDLGCMPFKITHGEQIKLVSSFDWLDLDSLDGIIDVVRDILDVDGSTIDPQRSQAIADYLERRISTLTGFIDSGKQPVDDPHMDLVLTDQ